MSVPLSEQQLADINSRWQCVPRDEEYRLTVTDTSHPGVTLNALDHAREDVPALLGDLAQLRGAARSAALLLRAVARRVRMQHTPNPATLQQAAADLDRLAGKDTDDARQAPAGESTRIPFEVANHVLAAANRGGYPAGSFTTRLLDAWNCADDTNHAALTRAFPEYGAALALLAKPGGVGELQRIAEGGEPRG